MSLTRVNKTFALKASSIDGNKISGAASGIGNLDSYDDVILPGAFDDCLADFLKNGFIADSHDWTKQIAMPLVAEPRGATLYSEAEFHSTPDAQVVRTKCMERMERGLSVGLSIGFGMMPTSYKLFANGAALLAFAKQGGYDMSIFDEAGVTACERKCRAILKVDALYEWSVVSLPANPEAQATSVKGQILPSTTVTKSKYLGDYVESSMTMAALSRLVDALFYNCVYDCIYDYDETPLPDRLALLAAAFDEFRDIALRTIEAILGGEEAGETGDEAMAALKALFPKPETKEFKTLPRAGKRLCEDQAEALAATQAVIERAKGLYALRVEKDGRKLSQATLETLSAHSLALAECKQTIDDLVASCAPPESGEEMADEKSVIALRARILQRKNRSRALLVGVIE